jgi:hypothetical protein
MSDKNSIVEIISSIQTWPQAIIAIVIIICLTAFMIVLVREIL